VKEGPKDDDGASEVAEFGIVQSGALPSNQKPAELIVPSVGSFNNPSARLPEDAAEECVLTTAANVRSNLTRANRPLDISVVVTLVEAQVLWSSRAARTTQRNGIENRSYHPLVVHVRCGNLERDRHASSISQNMSFRATFRPVCRVGTRVVPPFGAFTMALSRLVQSSPTPTAESYSMRSTRQSVLKRPCSLHSAKRRWQVAPEPNSLPSAFHGQPVRNL
jgi:hypothetical protein